MRKVLQSEAITDTFCPFGYALLVRSRDCGDIKVAEVYGDRVVYYDGVDFTHGLERDLLDSYRILRKVKLEDVLHLEVTV